MAAASDHGRPYMATMALQARGISGLQCLVLEIWHGFQCNRWGLSRSLGQQLPERLLGLFDGIIDGLGGPSFGSGFANNES